MMLRVHGKQAELIPIDLPMLCRGYNWDKTETIILKELCSIIERHA